MVQSLRRRHVRGACRSRTQLTAPPPQLGTLAAKVKPRSGSSYFHVRAESSRSRAFFAKTSDPERASSNTHSQTRRASRSHKGGTCFACVCEGRFPRTLARFEQSLTTGTRATFRYTYTYTGMWHICTPEGGGVKNKPGRRKVRDAEKREKEQG